jgi:Protein of unknown function (DUF992)
MKLTRNRLPSVGAHLMKATRNWKNAVAAFGLLGAVLASATPSVADPAVRYGVLSCDISGGIGLIFTEKQTMTCAYKPDDGTSPETYVGSIEEVGIELGSTSGGELTWVVVSLERGVPRGALAGNYIGLSANASLGEGFGANDLSGGFNRAYILQPYSVQTQSGINFAAGMTKFTLRAAN